MNLRRRLSTGPNYFHVHVHICNMITSSNENIFRVTGLCEGNSPVTGEFPPHRPVTRSYDGFFLAGRLSLCYATLHWHDNGTAGLARASFFHAAPPLASLQSFSALRQLGRPKAREPWPVWFSSICAWMNGWVNNHGAGDLRRHRAHYDVIVMICKASAQRSRQDPQDWNSQQ